jgi:hypothetical protein
MRVEPFISRVLADEGLTHGLNDPEARLLIEWLVEQVEVIAGGAEGEDAAGRKVEGLCQRARSIRRFVSLWCHAGEPGAAAQLAATERQAWPLPTPDMDDPCEVLQLILDCEQAEGRSPGSTVPE